MEKKNNTLGAWFKGPKYANTTASNGLADDVFSLDKLERAIAVIESLGPPVRFTKAYGFPIENHLEGGFAVTVVLTAGGFKTREEAERAMQKIGMTNNKKEPANEER